VPHLRLLRPKIHLGGIERGRLAGDALGHLNARPLHRVNFLRIIRKKPDAGELEIAENLPRQQIAAQVGLESEALIGFHRVGAGVLQLIGAQFVEQANASALLQLVNQNASIFAGYSFYGQLQLRAPAIVPLVRTNASSPEPSNP
jgi:hypothetical protein